MLPVELDHKSLNSLPLPADSDKERVSEILNAVLEQRVMAYFKNRRGTDPLLLARARQDLLVHRLEDEDEEIPLVSLLLHADQGWALGIHERIFDYIAFVTPRKPELIVGGRNNEERRMLAFVELMLRHSLEHLLYPRRPERDVIRSDLDFAMDLKKTDPTSYAMLRDALSDEMNGIRGKEYLDLLDLAEGEGSCECALSRMVHAYGATIGGLPDRVLDHVFPHLDLHVTIKVLGDGYRGSRSGSRALMERALDMQAVLQRFRIVMQKSREEAFGVFSAFKDRWGVISLFRELGLPEFIVEGKDGEALFEIFSDALMETYSGFGQLHADEDPLEGPLPASAIRESVQPPVAKGVEERIKEAGEDPFFSSQAMDLIFKNKSNAAGQSGAKYAELIETLLAIPWGKIRKISVSTAEFEEGLNKSHYGLEQPKEAICDFFANLIWRYEKFREEEWRTWKRTGSALLLVGPPGVGKTSLAISIARHLGIPYHKISLGGLRDEADIRGYGFTYEGSKPGPLVQGLIKMGVMNGMFIMDEADKTERFAIATLLEILDPEQNHLFHDKYTQTTVDIDLSNCHFILTANTLETVPAAVVNRCEVIRLSGYSLEDKIAIARRHLVNRVRERYMLSESEIYLDPKEERKVLSHLIREFTSEPGVRDLERILRTLFLRVHRKEIMGKEKRSVRLSRAVIDKYLETPYRSHSEAQAGPHGKPAGPGAKHEGTRAA